MLQNQLTPCFDDIELYKSRALRFVASLSRFKIPLRQLLLNLVVEVGYGLFLLNVSGSDIFPLSLFHSVSVPPFAVPN